MYTAGEILNKRKCCCDRLSLPVGRNKYKGLRKIPADFIAKHADLEPQINEQMCSLCRKSIESHAQGGASVAVYHHDPFPMVDPTELSSNTSSSDEVSDTTNRMDGSS